MRILFLGRRYLYFRNFESVIRELARRGHEIHLAVERDDIEGRPPLVDALTSAFPNITCGYAPLRAEDDWEWVASRLRLGLDYLRYQHPLFGDAPKLRSRARERTPGAFVMLANVIRRSGGWLRRPAAALVRRIERSVPDDPAIGEFVASVKPDVVLITPLIDLGSSQIDYLRAAQSLAIPTALCVWSWDHLSSKALIRDCPDRVFVWNDTQKREAIELHGVPAERIVVTGAQCFDQWFDRQPSRDRRTFSREIGLIGDDPYILYVCSAPFLGSLPEAPFVIEWIRRVRGSVSPELRERPILVRPHPSRTREWEDVDLGGLDNVVVRGGSPLDESSRADYFDALYHSAVVVGLNTSAFIEAGIVGRPVHAILAPQFAESQLGTVHFRYLLHAGGGLLQLAHDFDEHIAQLAASVTAPPAGLRPFVREFVRPNGLDVPATPLFVQAVEQMRERSTPSARAATSGWISRRIVAALARRRHDRSSKRWLHSERELEVIDRMRRLHERKTAREVELKAASRLAKQARLAEREREWAEHRAARAVKDAEKKAMRRAQ